MWARSWAFVGIAALFGAAYKLLSAAACGETRHEDGGQVFARIPLDSFTRVLLFVTGLALIGIGMIVAFFNFGHLF